SDGTSIPAQPTRGLETAVVVVRTCISLASVVIPLVATSTSQVLIRTELYRKESPKSLAVPVRSRSFGQLSARGSLQRLAIYSRIESDQLMGLQGKLKSIFDAGFLEDVHQVNLDGTDGDGQRVGDLFVFHTPADQREDFVLAWGQTRKVAAVEESDHLVGDGILDPDVTAADSAQAFDDGGNRKCFLQNAPHAALQRAKRLHLGDRSDPEDCMA